MTQGSTADRVSFASWAARRSQKTRWPPCRAMDIATQPVRQCLVQGTLLQNHRHLHTSNCHWVGNVWRPQKSNVCTLQPHWMHAIWCYKRIRHEIHLTSTHLYVQVLKNQCKMLFSNPHHLLEGLLGHVRRCSTRYHPSASSEDSFWTGKRCWKWWQPNGDWPSWIPHDYKIRSDRHMWLWLDLWLLCAHVLGHTMSLVASFLISFSLAGLNVIFHSGTQQGSVAVAWMFL